MMLLLDGGNDGGNDGDDVGCDVGVGDCKMALIQAPSPRSASI